MSTATEPKSTITINLRDFYPHLSQDEFVEVSTEIAAELIADKRYQKSHEQRIRRNMAFYSLDVGDGIENSAVKRQNDNPEAIIEMMDRYLVRTLPKAAYWLLGFAPALRL